MVKRLIKRISLSRGALDHRLRTLPVLVLYPHSRCNCRCVMCDIWKANATMRELTVEEITRHREDIRRLAVRQVVLSGGEPLMHSNLFRFCSSLLEDGIDITLITTGLLLDRFAGQVADSCAEVVVSLDGPEEIHDRIRNLQGAFRALARGVTELRNASNHIPVSGRCTVQRLNFEHLSQTVDAARQLGLTQISFLAADISSRAFNRPDGWPEERVQEVALSSSELPRLRQAVEELVTSHGDDIRNRYVRENSEQLRRIYDYFAALNAKGSFPALRCHAPWMSAVIDSEGNVFPCFFHPRYENLKGRSLREVLNSPQSIAFRRNLDVTTNPTCARCVCSIRHGGILDWLTGGRLL